MSSLPYGPIFIVVREALFRSKGYRVGCEGWYNLLVTGKTRGCTILHEFIKTHRCTIFNTSLLISNVVTSKIYRMHLYLCQSRPANLPFCQIHNRSISGADPGFDQGGPQIVTGLKLPFWGLSFV